MWKDLTSIPLTFTTPICVLIQFVFHWILNELGQICHGENGQPFSEWTLVVIDK